MWIGFWPPSNRARRLAPEREPQPFCPRPEVLPVPEPSPRPTRLRGRRDPGPASSCAARSAQRQPSSDTSTRCLHLRDHAPRSRRDREPRRLANARRPSERSVSRCRLSVPFHDRHWVTLTRSRGAPRLSAGLPSTAAAGSSAASRVADIRSVPFPVSRCPPPARRPSSSPRTWFIDEPAQLSNLSGVRRDSSPAIVALTRLIGFWIRRLDRMSSSPRAQHRPNTAPAITPVPGEAASDHAAGANTPPSGGDRRAVLGHAVEVLLRPLDAFWIARGPRRLPVADPDDSRSSPRRPAR